MDLKTYLAILNRHRIVIIGTLLFAVIAAVGGTFLLTPKYDASATLRFATAISGSTDWVQYNIDYTDRLMNTYSQLASGGNVRAELMKEFQLSEAPQINVKILANSELMQTGVTHPNPELAAQMANRLAQFLIEEGAKVTDSNRQRAQELLQQQITQAEEDIRQTQAELDAVIGDDAKSIERRNTLSRTIGAQKSQLDQIRKEFDNAQLQERLQSTTISVVDPAVVPTKPSSPSLLLNLALGIFAGLVGGLGTAFLLHNFDTKVRSADQLQGMSNLPVLGEIPESKGSTSSQNGDREVDPVGYDAFRRLGISLIARANKQGFSSFLVTSTQSQEGRSTIVANLAWSFAESGREVIVVDCDFQSPMMHVLFGLQNHIGLSNILHEQEWLYKQRLQGPKATPYVNGFSAPNGMSNGIALANGLGIPSGVATAKVADAEYASSTVLNPNNGSYASEAPDMATMLHKSLEMSLTNSLQRTMIPGVQVLTTGPLTLNNPVQLLSSLRLKNLFEELQHRCDVVLVDAPAYASAAYTSTLASVADAVVFVVGYGQVKQEVVKESINNIRTVNPQVIGLVANRARLQK
ncbi:MAG: Wzz/FepE/Etk N-terminal domain-containing protein [Caldilineaceae bacterium]